MLVAEIHGKVIAEAANSEDYLTSAVFGHLRYLPPPCFWPSLFARARGADQGGNPLTRALEGRGVAVGRYTRLIARFWRFHPTIGEPDLILTFTGGGQPDFTAVVEVKLWSGKSGCGDDDQLCRYLRLLDQRRWLGVSDTALPPVLVYLTPRASQAELEESLALMPDASEYRGRIYRLQWQDVLSAAKAATSSAQEPMKTLLSDVSSFLARRQLEYFDGFKTTCPVPDLMLAGGFYHTRPDQSRRFRGMNTSVELPFVQIVRGGWVR